jgi:Uma2 family endonuclease
VTDEARRPALDLQYWFADVAYVPRTDWDALPPDQYPVYVPALIVELLSPSNTPAKVNRQRIIAMSAGTKEVRVVDPENRTVQVTDLSGAKVYTAGDHIPVPLFSGGSIAVDQILAV